METRDMIRARNELDNVFPFHEKPLKQRAYFGKGKGSHLIVVQLESFQNFLINASLQGQPVTPVMNQLSKESLYFPRIFQQIGIGNTSDAEFLVNTSIYPVGSKPMSTTFSSRMVASLAMRMQQEGYKTRTFHVNDVSYWNRDEMYPALGFQKYYDRPYYRNETFSRFGASDEELFRVGMNKMKAMDESGELFYSQFVTVSSHSPFTIPEHSRTLKLPSSLRDRRLGHYLSSVHYADYALGTLISSLKTSGLWDRSVFVVYGDHFGLHRKYHQPEEISRILNVPYDPQISTFNVPLMIHLPHQHEGRIMDRTGGQVDLMPTIMNIMGIRNQAESTMFGHDLLNIEHNIIGIRYYSQPGTFVNDEVLFVPGVKGFADGMATSIRTLQRVEDIRKYKFEYDYILQWMKLSDQYVKKLPSRKPET
ncbi:LTA synthase family protein [Paenibacillus sp. SAF-054]|uniref:LTA synthase family protein n=1 Tax=unclassified Paenibacillus TaxID=185978 RepID=UPI003F7EF363